MNLLLKIAFIGKKNFVENSGNVTNQMYFFFLILPQFNLSEPSIPTVLHFFLSVI